MKCGYPMFHNNPATGAGPDKSVGRKILALMVTRANRKTSKIKKGPIFWRKKVIVILQKWRVSSLIVTNINLLTLARGR